MITKTAANEFGLLIKAATQCFIFATTNDQVATDFIKNWATAREVLQKYSKIRTEIKTKWEDIGHDTTQWRHYCNVLETQLLQPAIELDRLCQDFLDTDAEVVSSDEVDEDFRFQEHSPFERVTADVQEKLQRLIATAKQEVNRATNTRLKLNNATPPPSTDEGNTNNSSSENIPPPRKDQAPYNSFEELFYRPEDISMCVDALRKCRPEKPILGEGLNWTGGQKDKGFFVAWIERMETMKKPKIAYLGNRKQLVQLLNAYFVNLNLGKDARMFSNGAPKEKKDAFLALLPN